MYLHKNRTLFEEVIIETNNRTGFAQSIIEIAEFINNDFYEKDYNTLTKVLITDDVTYEDTILVLKEIAVQLFD